MHGGKGTLFHFEAGNGTEIFMVFENKKWFFQSENFTAEKYKDYSGFSCHSYHLFRRYISVKEVSLLQNLRALCTFTVLSH